MAKEAAKTETKFSALTYWACGGAGINICSELLKGAKTLVNKNARIIGLDTSDKNTGDGAFVIERTENTFGSGKDRAKNFEKGIPFIEAVLKKHKAGRYNIIVSNTAGGSGSTFAILLARALIADGQIAILMLGSDHTSMIEKELSVTGLQSFANQTATDMLDAPICYTETLHTEDKSRGEVNREMVISMNLASMLFDEGNGEIDYEDIKRLFRYSAGGKVPPALSRITFYDQNNKAEHKGKPPVAVASLFKNSDDVKPTFMGSVYRTTGVFNPELNLPEGLTELHVTLDHGDALALLKEEMESIDEDKAKVVVDYVKQEPLKPGSATNAFGLVM